jgi:diguanylate cyclase (GGDEF)-like protein
MIKTDFSQPKNDANRSSTFFALSNVLYGLNFGVLGGVTNAFLSVNFLGDFNLYFGQIFVLFCLVNRGLNAGIITALITSTVAAMYANDPYLVAILSLEILFIHVCMRRGFFLFQSSMAYWLLIGIPLLLCLHWLTSFTSADLLFIGGITLGLNGLLCISVVAISCWFLPSYLIYKKYYVNPPQLSSLIFSLCMLTVTLPAIVIALFFIWQSSVHNEKIVEQELTNITSKLASMNDIEMQRHLNSIETIASIIHTDVNVKIQPLIAATVNNYRLFDSILITDKFGQISHFAVAKSHNKNSNQNHLSISTQEHFKKARELSNAFITNIIVTNKQDSQPTILFIAPIFDNTSFVGVVQGSMTLQKLMAFNEGNLVADYLYTITDAKGRLIAHSQALNTSVLANFEYQTFQHQLVKTVPSLTFNQKEYLYQQNQTQTGWTITVMTSVNKVTSVLVDYFFILMLATILVLAIFAFIANSLSIKITKPLVDIAENFPDTKLHPDIIRKSRVSSEMVKLTQKLIDSHNVMSNFHQQLSEQVHTKTKQLKQLNRELYSIAQKDSLTQLLNRAGFNRLAIASYRNCLRNQINMSLILLDIDHFKLVNDTYGHPFGDECIIAVAKTIQKHCKRDTDIIGRYGGEEFIVMIVGGEISEHTDRIKLIKDEVENLSLTKDKQNIKMTISAGISSLANDFLIDYEDLLQLCDNQLYISKREGRNKISSVIL